MPLEVTHACRVNNGSHNEFSFIEAARQRRFGGQGGV